MSTITRYAIAVLVLSIAVGEAKAQFGLLTERGAGASLGFASQENVTQLGFNAGYVVHPMFEVGLGASHSQDDESQLNATGVGPFVGFYPVRMSASMPVSVRLGAGYSHHSFGGEGAEALEALGVSMSGNSLLGSGALFLGVPIQPTLYLVPLVEAGYVHTNLRLESSGASDTDSDNTTYVTVGGSLIVAASPSTRLAFTPTITFNEGTSTFGLSAMVVLPR